MRRVFVDTHYWIAIAAPRDQHREHALKAHKALGKVALVTTDEVLCEVLSWFCDKGNALRQLATKMIRTIIDNPNVLVIPQTRGSFLRGLAFYEKRSDKEYSLVDCICMETMRVESIRDVLTNDHHFAQESFNVLIKK